MIKGIIRSMYGTVNERLTSPLFGSFITAWLVLNWRIVYTILRPLDTTEATISKIETYITLWPTFIIPLAASLFYVSVFPWIRFGLWQLQSKPVGKQRCGEYEWELRILKARREVLTLEYDLSLIRVEKETEIELKKMQAQAKLEESRVQLEERKMQTEHELRHRELDLREREQGNARANPNGPARI